MSFARIDSVRARAFTFPTETPEADGTLEWQSTTLVVVELQAGRDGGLGYTYSNQSAVPLIRENLAPVVVGSDPMEVTRTWQRMRESTRNIGTRGLVGTAISALDVALWDLKGRCLGVSLERLFGAVREEVLAYASGGFTSYDQAELCRRMSGDLEAGFSHLKMKVGSEPDQDVERVRAVRDAVGKDAVLFVDANGAYDRKEALGFAERFVEMGVSWFEEPVSSDDREGLRLLRDRAPRGMEISAGEYGYDIMHFHDLLSGGCVDVVQADATRCLGYTGFLQAMAVAEAHHVPASTHTAPALHRPLGLCSLPVRHVEYFYDHARLERLFFDGVEAPHEGALRATEGRPGLGLSLKEADVERYLVAA